MEATVIKIHNRDVCKLVDLEKINKVIEFKTHWIEERLNISRKKPKWKVHKRTNYLRIFR